MDEISALSDRVHYLKKLLTRLPTSVFVTNMSSVEIASKKGKDFVESLGLRKKRDLLKSKFSLSGSEEVEEKKIKDIIVETGESEGTVKIEKSFTDSETQHFYLRFDSMLHKEETIYILIFSDITEVRKTEEDKALHKFKSVMFASMTHEIRTPLNAIINSCDVILMDQDATDSVIDCTEICKSSASLLSYMTYNILDFSRMESGEFREERMPFSIRALLEKIALISEPHARLKKLKFELEIEDEIENTEVINDERRIIQVLLNLIMNAIKYTKVGKVRLKISQLNVFSNVGTNGTDLPFLVFSVTDTGQGIAESKKENLFKLFGNYQTNDYCQSTSIGLGLAVSKKIVRNMDGCL